MSTEIAEKIRKAAILNAIRHDGRADPQAVLGNLLGDNPDLRSKAKEILPSVRQVVQEINSIPMSEIDGTRTRVGLRRLPRSTLKK